MAAVKELIRVEADGSISFGDYELAVKTKLKDFNHQGDLYKVKTFQEITKLERNDLFVYESVPGTAVENFLVSADSVEFKVSGPEDAQITLGMEEDTEYVTQVDGHESDRIKTSRGGKLVLSVELGGKESVGVKVVKA
ncbi:endosialidase [bacterium 1XD21-13]|nr:endosialidase [bacterium 1XD21-13]